MNKEKSILFSVAGGVSEQTGLPLEKGWAADHIIPKAAGGTDDIANKQALRAAENLNKSCAHIKPRGWQERFLLAFNRKTGPDFLLVALPGSGKTIAALIAATQWLKGDPGQRRFLVVVPTD